MKRPYRRNIQPTIGKSRGICTSELYTRLGALMSTKSTIASSDNFHFYHEVFDDDHVYLRLDTTHFEAGHGSVMVRIPIHIWETIRHLAGVEFDLVDKEDEDLLAMVESNVDQRLAKYRESLCRTAVRAEFVSLFGFASYGGADAPRESQIRHGMEYFLRERQRQHEMRARIAALQKDNPPSAGSRGTAIEW